MQLGDLQERTKEWPTEFISVMSISIVGMILRLMHLTSGLGEAHGWRQAVTAMIARNFYRNGFDITHPQIDFAGPLPGYVGTEFPLVPYLAALLYLPFGEHLYLGRLISIMFFAMSLPFFYFLVRRYFKQKTAWFALFFYVMSPLNIYYTRTFMPDSAMMCFSIAAIFFFARWMDTNSVFNCLLALVCATFAILVKVPAALIGLPMAYLAWRRYGWDMFREWRLWIFSLGAVIPSGIWYSHAMSLAAKHYPFHFFGDGSGIWVSGIGIFLRLEWYRIILLQVTAFVLTPFGLLMAMGGLILLTRKRPETYLFHWWALGLFVYVIVAMPGQLHEHYQLPFVPVAATFAGRFCEWVFYPADRRFTSSWQSKRGVVGVVVIGTISLTSYVLVKTKYHSETNQRLYVGGEMVDTVVPNEALIVVADWKNPVLIYASKRRGWHFPGHESFWQGSRAWRPAELEVLRSQGARYFIALVRPDPRRERQTVLHSVGRYIFQHRVNDFLDSYPEFESYLESHYSKILSNEFVEIYDLRQSSSEV